MSTHMTYTRQEENLPQVSPGASKLWMFTKVSSGSSIPRANNLGNAGVSLLSHDSAGFVPQDRVQDIVVVVFSPGADLG